MGFGLVVLSFRCYEKIYREFVSHIEDAVQQKDVPKQNSKGFGTLRTVIAGGRRRSLVRHGILFFLIIFIIFGFKRFSQKLY